MPTRHGKNNCAGSVFTYEERRKLNWGTKKRRAGRDSIKDWDACALCLHQVVNPRVCPSGHIFCQECIYTCLLAQKQENKRKLALWEAQQEQTEQREQEKEVEAQEKELEAFGRQEMGILPASTLTARDRKSVLTRDHSTGYQKLTTTHGKAAFVVDRDLVAATAAKRMHERNAEEKAIQKALTPAFWVPEMTPEAGERKLEKPPGFTKCPQGIHPLRLKQLKPLNLVLADPSETESSRSHRSGRYICPSCKSALINSGTQYALVKCGHVLCRECVDQFVKKERRCPSCSEGCRRKDVILLERGSSGFAAGGAHMATAKNAPAFQCF